jgi:hypothetical protein
VRSLGKISCSENLKRKDVVRVENSIQKSKLKNRMEIVKAKEKKTFNLLNYVMSFECLA